MSNFEFGATEVTGSSRAPRLKRPYCGPAILESIEKRTVSVSGEEKVLLQFNYQMTDNSQFADTDIPIKVHQTTEWEPDESDTVPPSPNKNSKLQNKLNRIGYTLKYFIGEEDAKKLTQMKGSTLKEAWELMVDNIVEAFEDIDTTSKKDLKAKVTGSVWKGNAKLRMPNYLGFLSDSNSEYPVSFTQREEEENREYMRAISETPSSNEEVETADFVDMDF